MTVFGRSITGPDSSQIFFGASIPKYHAADKYDTPSFANGYVF